MTQPDWRRDNGRRLDGFPLRHRRYQRWSEAWDHDHCATCGAKFSELDEPDVLHEGYATGGDDPLGPGYDWVCETCFRELKAERGWTTPDEPIHTSSAAC